MESESSRRYPPPPTSRASFARLGPRRFAEGGEKRTSGLDEAPQANYGTAATIPTLDPELAKQLGFTTEEEDAEAIWHGRRATRWKRSASPPPPTRWKL